VRAKTLLGVAMTTAALAVPVAATAAGKGGSGTIRNPYFCGKYTFPATATYSATWGYLAVAAKKGAKVHWKTKKGACGFARKHIKHAYWKNAHMFLPGWKCKVQYGTATCTRSRIEILWTFS
jgi:hypothetical protein